MNFDIYGEPLRRGHCEVHPHVHEEYPCSVCVAERNAPVPGQCVGGCESEHYLGQAQEHIEHLNARIAELEAQVRTAGAIPVKSFVVISEDEDVIEVPDTDLGQALLMLEVARDEEPDKAWSLQAEVDADEARRLRGEDVESKREVA